MDAYEYGEGWSRYPFLAKNGKFVWIWANSDEDAFEKYREFCELKGWN